MHERTSTSYCTATYVTTNLDMFSITQRDTESMAEYYKRFKETRDIFRQTHGKHYMDDWIQCEVPGSDKATTAPEQLILKLAAQDQMMAYLLIIGALPSKYGSLQASLEERHNRGFDEWPKTLKAAKDILSEHVLLHAKWTPVAQRNRRGNHNGITLNQAGKDLSHIMCNCCGVKGHYSTCCPKVASIAPDKWFKPKNPVLAQSSNEPDNEQSEQERTSGVQAAIETTEAAPELAIAVTAKRLRKPTMKMDGQQCKSSRKMSQCRDWSSSSRESGLR
jgi:hypothetical protein